MKIFLEFLRYTQKVRNIIFEMWFFTYCLRVFIFILYIIVVGQLDVFY